MASHLIFQTTTTTTNKRSLMISIAVNFFLFKNKKNIIFKIKNDINKRDWESLSCWLERRHENK